MKRLFFYACIFLYLPVVHAQGYAAEVQAWQHHYKQEFLSDPRSPIKAKDTAYLRFYKADENYRSTGVFVLTPDSKPFGIATHSGKTKPYRCYGKISFPLQGNTYSLEVYQGMDLIKKKEYADYLFIPFTDLTNNETTFGGGRYIDLKTGDIKNGKVVLDFNKAYNPYCAFGEGFSCPIPPDANKLQVRIDAGEQNFGKKID